jgi:hypothetical protein
MRFSSAASTRLRNAEAVESIEIGLGQVLLTFALYSPLNWDSALRGAGCQEGMKSLGKLQDCCSQAA